eukprot:m.93799 g.93799  ORF g.93799 m.93799 type:complete len:528 (+) comp10017_c0_seq1:278-1861(+)
MPRRENGAQRKIRRDAKAEKKKRADAKAKAKEEAARRGGEEEKSVEEILAELDAEAQAKEVKPEETTIPQPTPRLYGSLTPHPVKKDALILFGGEFNDGRATRVYADLMIFYPNKCEWRRLTVANPPPPRSAHQAVATTGGDAALFIFGGEFTSPNGSQFYHYNDFWKLPLNVPLPEMAWEKVDAPGGPSPRSGHRMVLYKRKIVVIGGFQDNNRSSPRYFNDAWVFDLDQYAWKKLSFPATMLKPDPRSGVQLAPCPDGVVVFGGYSMSRVKGDIFRGQQHADTWMLEYRGEPDGAADAGADGGAGAAAGSSAKGGDPHQEWAWVKIKCAGVDPNLKSGAAMAVRAADGRAYSFGGVEDTEEDDSMESTFFNHLFRVDMSKRPTWHTMDSGKGGGGGGAAAAAAAAEVGGPPSARINAHVCVQGSVLWVYGGSIEHGSRHITLSDLHHLDVGKKSAQWTQVHGHDRKTEEWLGEESSSSESESDDEDEAAAVGGGGGKPGGKGRKKGANPLKARLAATAGGFPKQA